jgi:hypothetical protein
VRKPADLCRPLTVMEAIMCRTVLALAIGAGLLAATAPATAPAARAQDAEFGCKVLLCAAASNPSWPAIPYCVPVMNQLHAMMRRIRFRWPVCTAAGTGAPGFEPYQPCPPGWQQTSSQTGGGDTGAGHQLQPDQDLCARRLPPVQSGRLPQASMPGGQIQCPAQASDHGGAIASGHMDSSLACIEFMPRPLNERPYYLDVRKADGHHSRVWFNVR